MIKAEGTEGVQANLLDDNAVRTPDGNMSVSWIAVLGMAIYHCGSSNHSGSPDCTEEKEKQEEKRYTIE